MIGSVGGQENKANQLFLSQATGQAEENSYGSIEPVSVSWASARL